MSLESAFAPVEAYNRALVMHQTWGHLAPEPRVNYSFKIVFCEGQYRDTIIIRTETQLEDSPWLFDHMMDFICDKALETGKVYEFEGTYMMYKNGGCRFSGKTKVVY